jgi:hypothetical protein
MPTFSAYCRAYSLDQLRTYDQWRENADALVREIPPEEEGSDAHTVRLGGEDYVFLHDTFAVTEGIFNDERIIFDAVTPEWVAFCRQTLGFDEHGGNEPR